jgi:hypothetical protein
MNPKVNAPPPIHGGGRSVVFSLAANNSDNRVDTPFSKDLCDAAQRAEHQALVCQGLALALRTLRRFEAQSMADRHRLRAHALRLRAVGGAA